MAQLDEKKVGSNIDVVAIPQPSAARSSYTQPNHSVAALSTIDDTESMNYSLSQAPTTVAPDGKTDLNPFSPFYDHGGSRTTTNTTTTSSVPAPINTAAYDTDLEAGTPPTSACSLDKPSLSKSSAVGKNKGNVHCTVWPGREAMKMKKKAMRRQKARYMLCGWMAGLSKPVRIWIKVIIAMVFVGAAVGIAIGISKAVGGGVWKNSHTPNAPIGHSQGKLR